MNYATTGLVKYRLGDHATGRALYAHAIQLADDAGLREQRAWALLFLAREEVNARSTRASEVTSSSGERRGEIPGSGAPYRASDAPTPQRQAAVDSPSDRRSPRPASAMSTSRDAWRDPSARCLVSRGGPHGSSRKVASASHYQLSQPASRPQLSQAFSCLIFPSLKSLHFWPFTVKKCASERYAVR